jgi:hypothetical protein
MEKGDILFDPAAEWIEDKRVEVLEELDNGRVYVDYIGPNRHGPSIVEASRLETKDPESDNNLVEVALPYSDDYTFSEKSGEICDNIPDTDEAYSMFKYCPAVKVEFQWDKDENELEPLSVEIDGDEYELTPKS